MNGPRKSVSLAILLLGVSLGGVQAQTKTRKFDAVRVPPGVTPLTTTQADSLAQQLFVSRDQVSAAESLLVQAQEYRAQSDSLWKILDEAAARPKPVAVQDSLAALRATVEGYQNVKKGSELMQQLAKSQNEKTKQQAIALLLQAEQSLRKAVELNPHFSSARLLLAGVYKLLAQRDPEQGKSRYDQAITMWETIVRLEPGEFRNYLQLAQHYYAVQAWGEALNNFQKCEQRLLASAEVQDSRIGDPSQPVAAAVDSASLFLAVYYQVQCNIQRNNTTQNDETQAYASLKRAREFAMNPQYNLAVENSTRWLDWDDGHILGAKMRDSTNVLSSRGEFAKAAKIYEDMIPKMRTDRARHEFGWKLALLEYSNLNQKAKGVERMLRIVQSIPTDEAGRPRVLSRGDTLGQTYFDNFGTMCVNFGNENREANRKLSYTYYMQSAAVNWSGRAKSYYAMALLADANPRQAVADAERAYASAHQLDPDELINLNRLLIRNYRRLGLFDKAKEHFSELARLLGANTGAGPGL